MVIGRGNNFPITIWGKFLVLLEVFSRLSLGCSVAIGLVVSSIVRFFLVGSGLRLSLSALSDDSQ